MKLGQQFDLTYCSNIHAGETWQEVATALAHVLPRVREQLGVSGAFGIGLRLSNAAAEALEQPAAMEAFREFLAHGDYYVPTINGFPYGAFHGTRVKERVYLPDWRTDERLEYTDRLARVLAALAVTRGETEASISTVPCAFRAHLASAGDVTEMAVRMLRHAACLKRLQLETGVTIRLAIEPEPACYLETAAEAIVYFREHLLDSGNVGAASREAGIALSADDVANHVGICLDTCHMAVEFEEPSAVVDALAAAGMRICKVQLSSAVRVARDVSRLPARELLAPFAEDTYLHQVVTSEAGELTRYTDLPDALAPAERPADDVEWRVHFHVPVFLASMSGLGSTQAYLAEVLQVLRRTGACRCLEVETYTWDVLPPEYRTTDVSTAIARELAWVRTALGYGDLL